MDGRTRAVEVGGRCGVGHDQVLSNGWCGREVAGATGSLVARSQRDGRDSVLTFSIDLWNLTFPAPGDYSFRILVNGSERKRLPLLLLAPDSGAGEGIPTSAPGDG